jgi:hypothetical protein
MERNTITKVTRDASGRRLLHQVDPATKRDVDKPQRDPKDGARPDWARGYPLASGFEVK